MRQDDRAPFDRALRRARVSAYAPGEFVGQESFMTAGEIRALAAQAGVGPGVTVLDLGCGIGGPGRLLTRELGCAYLGVDFSASAVAIARRARGRPAVPLRDRARPAAPRRLLRRRAPARGDARHSRTRTRCCARSPRRSGPAGASPSRSRKGRRSRRPSGRRCPTPTRSGSPRSTTLAASPGAGRARRHLAGGPQPRAPRDGAGARGRVRRRRRAHRRADRPPGAGRPARRPPAVDRVAGRGAGAEARAGGAAGLAQRAASSSISARTALAQSATSSSGS